MSVECEILTAVTGEYYLVRCDAVSRGANLVMFWINVVPPSSMYKVQTFVNFCQNIQ